MPARHGFHSGVLYCALAAGLVFFANLKLPSVVVGTDGIHEGLGTIRRGNCQSIKTMDTVLHLLINVLSTALLSASKYYMQFHSAPTRRDIDGAHCQYSWMHVGVPSISDFWHISWARKTFWIMLLFSSVPLHLIYNSAIFTTLSGQEVSVSAVSNNFIKGASYEVPAGAFDPTNITVTDPNFGNLDPQDISRKLSNHQKVRSFFEQT